MDMKEFLENVKFGAYHDHQYGADSYIWCWLINAYGLLKNLATERVVCKYFGHKYEDTGSWAGPESGGEDLTCCRCGSNFHHVYY